jgi:SAM-dependent methyltransferase
VIASLRKQLKRNKWALIAYTILHSARVRWRFQQGKFDSITGSTHMKFSDEQSVAYCLRQYNEYFEYGHLTPEMLAGRTMLEYGPGDNVGVGLLFIAAGIRYYAATDKFDAIRDVEKERRIYQKLREGLTDDAARKRFDAAVDLSQGIVFNPERVKCVYGVGAEDADTQFKEPFDFLISRGVLQEIYEGEKLFTSMDKLLKPGGWMLHKVDHRDYGLFNANGFPALEFLTVSEGIYQLMAKKSDRPARRLMNYYRDQMRTRGYRGILYKAYLIADYHHANPNEIIPHKAELVKDVDYTSEHEKMIRDIRPRLVEPFRSLPEADLLVAGTFQVAQKPPFSADGPPAAAKF